jgi:8-oxo-dGTP diphosphatase
VKAGPYTEVSGTVAIDDDGKIHGAGDPYGQTRYILQKLKKTLEQAGVAWSDVVRTRMYVTDIAHWPAIGRAHREAFQGMEPAATMVQVQQLILPGLLVEIEISALTDAQFSYAYARPALTTDILLLRGAPQYREVLLIKRKDDPYKGLWALPGGFVEENETLEQCAHRELAEETGLTNIPIRQFKAYSAPGRDPRGWTISVVFTGAVPGKAQPGIRAGDDAAETKWFITQALPALAFDHEQILREFLEAGSD